jgi:hypothetical protein
LGHAFGGVAHIHQAATVTLSSVPEIHNSDRSSLVKLSDSQAAILFDAKRQE